MEKTNLIKFDLYFDEDSNKFVAINSETGEIKDFTSPKKSSSAKKKADTPIDMSLKLTLESNKYTITQGAADALGVETGDRLDIKYDKINKTLVPVIGSNDSFGTKSGNLLNKSLGVSCRGKANEELSEYGTVFTLEPHPTKSGIFILVGDKPLPEPEEDDAVEIDDDEEDEVDIKDDIDDLLAEADKSDDVKEITNFDFSI